MFKHSRNPTKSAPNTTSGRASRKKVCKVGNLVGSIASDQSSSWILRSGCVRD